MLFVALIAWLPLACGPEPAPPAPPGGPVAYDANGRALGPVALPARRPNLIVILIDTLRADSLSAAQPEKGVMPNLAALAARRTACVNAVAPAPWTGPSVASLLTGLLPSAHRQSAAHFPPPSTGPLTYFPEILAATYGYETVAMTGLGENDGGRATFSGFNVLVPGFLLQAAPDMLTPWVQSRRKEQPFFLLLHTYEVHDPYGAANHPYPPLQGAQLPLEELTRLGEDPDPAVLVRRYLTEGRFRNLLRGAARERAWMPRVVGYFFDGLRREPNAALGPDLRQAYDAGAAWVDGLLAQTLALLERQGLLEDTLLVVTSDHGEAFGEHGALQHQRWIYDELLRVPLVLHGPPPFDRPRLVRGQVALHDLLPTFFEWAGLALPQGLDGRSFLPLLAQDGPGRVVLSEEVRTPLTTAGRSHDDLEVSDHARDPRRPRAGRALRRGARPRRAPEPPRAAGAGQAHAAAAGAPRRAGRGDRTRARSHLRARTAPATGHPAPGHAAAAAVRCCGTLGKHPRAHLVDPAQPRVSRWCGMPHSS